MYDMKALYEAYTVEEAVKLRLEHPEAQIIAGGTDVLVQMREGRRAGKELISIQKSDGSWVNTNNRWWEADPVLVTSYCVLALEQLYHSIPR